jgi:hypothetical protein
MRRNQGRTTASGEPFDASRLTAAPRRLLDHTRRQQFVRLSLVPPALRVNKLAPVHTENDGRADHCANARVSEPCRS